MLLLVLHHQNSTDYYHVTVKDMFKLLMVWAIDFNDILNTALPSLCSYLFMEITLASWDGWELQEEAQADHHV